MKLIESLSLKPDKPELISLVGGGGKTSTMFALARELKTQEKKVLITTTTNMALEETSGADKLIIAAGLDWESLRSIEAGAIICLGGGVLHDKEKITGVDRQCLDEIYQKHIFDVIIVEADGARQKPVKAPDEYEPVIPSTTTMTIGIIGLDALGKPITDLYVHRPELFCDLTKQKKDDIIDRQSLVNLIVSDRGLLKGVPSGSSRYVLFNKADSAESVKEAEATVEALIKMQAHVDCFVVASIGKGSIYSARQGDSPWLVV